jgi:hypothetical protein
LFARGLDALAVKGMASGLIGKVDWQDDLIALPKRSFLQRIPRSVFLWITALQKGIA